MRFTDLQAIKLYILYYFFIINYNWGIPYSIITNSDTLMITFAKTPYLINKLFIILFVR